MSHQSTALPIAWISLRIIRVLNWLWGICIFAILVATVASPDWTLTALGAGPDHPLRAALVGLQGVAVLGLVAITLNDFVLKRLLRIVETVRSGDPFVAANAYRLHGIAWALLGLQCLSLAIGAIGKAISTPEYPIHLDAGFSTAGWLAVVLMFVLARVFAEGTLMRADLEGTI
jgi:hypothetical protein